jgi:hypothetical protein
MLTNSPRIRITVYLLAVAASIAAAFVTIIDPELGGAFTTTAAILTGVAGVTAVSNVEMGGRHSRG